MIIEGVLHLQNIVRDADSADTFSTMLGRRYLVQPGMPNSLGPLTRAHSDLWSHHVETPMQKLGES